METLKKSMYYEFERSPKISSNYLQMLLVMSMVSGHTYLGDLSKVYLRTYAGLTYELEELRSLFKEFAAFKLDQPEDLSAIPLEASQVGWRQPLKDDYL